MYFEVHGSRTKELLLCIGGWGLLTGSHFEILNERLRERYQIIVFDHRGLGASDPGSCSDSTADYALDAEAVLRACDSLPVHVIGQGGLGAAVAQMLAVQEPTFLKDVVLTAGWAWPEPFHTMQLEALYALRRDSGFEAFRGLCLTLCNLPETVNDSTYVSPRGWTGPANIQERTEAHLQLIRANITHDARLVLGRIRCPVLIVCGGEDILGGPRLARDLQQRISGARLEILEGVPHVIGSVQGASNRYAAMVDEFFQENYTNTTS